MVYRVQNHAMDLVVPGLNQNDSLLISVDDSLTPVCTHVPRQLTKEQLTALLPEKWITAYERLQKPPPPVTQTDPVFTRLPDDSVQISFPARRSPSSLPDSFSTRHAEINMISLAPEPRCAPDIKSFTAEGTPVYAFKMQDGHCPWDLDCTCDACLYGESDDDEPLPQPQRCSPNRRLQKRYDDGDPSVGLLGQPSGKFDYYVTYGPPTPAPSPPQPLACHMFQHHEEDFPPLRQHHDMRSRTSYRWTIPDPSPEKPVAPAEASLNWSNHNAAQQNKVLTQLSKQQQQTQDRLAGLQTLIERDKQQERDRRKR